MTIFTKNNRRVCLWLSLSLLSLPAAAAAATANADKAPIIVFAAASLTNALQDLGDGYTKETSIPVRFSFAASSALARQIENGAAADIFFSADVEWMDYLQSRNLIQRDTRRDALGNRLVLIAPTASRIKLKIGPQFPLAAALGKSGHLATGDPDAVPAGRYARESLTTLGVWNGVADRLVRADSVRSALAFVDRGEAQLGIVYETDALDRQARTGGGRVSSQQSFADRLSDRADPWREARRRRISGVRPWPRGRAGVQSLRLHALALTRGAYLPRWLKPQI